MKYLWERIVALAGSNLGLKILAVVIAVGLWVAGHRDVERAVEVARAADAAYVDPKDKDGKLYAVDVEPVKKLKNPVTLAAIKAEWNLKPQPSSAQLFDLLKKNAAVPPPPA